MAEPRSAILHGTLELMVLETLDQMGPLHGYGIGRMLLLTDPSAKAGS